MVENCTLIATEITTQINHASLAESDITIKLMQNSEDFKLLFHYTGLPFRIHSIQKIDTDANVDEEIVNIGLKTYLIGAYPDEVLSKIQGNQFTFAFLL